MVSGRSNPKPDAKGKIDCLGGGKISFYCSVADFDCCHIDVTLNEEAVACVGKAGSKECRVSYSASACKSGASLVATPTACHMSGASITVTLSYNRKFELISYFKSHFELFSTVWN